MARKTQLIKPDQVVCAAKRKEKENQRFRAFLKNHADPDVLDRQFLELHQQIFPRYDCSQCRNCCKLLHGEIPAWEIDRDAAWLHMTREELISKHLERAGADRWIEKHLPCGFLMENGGCRLGDCQPDNCKSFPYTDQPGRLSSLYSVLNAASVCPAAYEILEALKQVYDFDSYRRRKRRVFRMQEADAADVFIADVPLWVSFWDGADNDDLPSEELPF